MKNYLVLILAFLYIATPYALESSTTNEGEASAVEQGQEPDLDWQRFAFSGGKVDQDKLTAVVMVLASDDKQNVDQAIVNQVTKRVNPLPNSDQYDFKTLVFDVIYAAVELQTPIPAQAMKWFEQLVHGNPAIVRDFDIKTVQDRETAVNTQLDVPVGSRGPSGTVYAKLVQEFKGIDQVVRIVNAAQKAQEEIDMSGSSSTDQAAFRLTLRTMGGKPIPIPADDVKNVLADLTANNKKLSNQALSMFAHIGKIEHYDFKELILKVIYAAATLDLAVPPLTIDYFKSYATYDPKILKNFRLQLIQSAVTSLTKKLAPLHKKYLEAMQSGDMRDFDQHYGQQYDKLSRALETMEQVVAIYDQAQGGQKS